MVWVVGLGLSGCCSSGASTDKLPASIPIYPGAKLMTADKTLGISNFQYHTQDEGQKVRDWYSAQSDKLWTDKCGAEWRKRTEMLGMRIEYRCFKSKGSDGYYRVEIGDNPSKPPRVIRLRHCPGSRADRCGHEP